MKDSSTKSGALRFGQFYGLGDALSAVKHINGSSLTVPGQARDLAALLASSKYQGGMIPIHGNPQFDEDLAHGFARVQLESMDEEEVSEIARRAVQVSDDKEKPAPDAEEVSDDQQPGE